MSHFTPHASETTSRPSRRHRESDSTAAAAVVSRPSRTKDSPVSMWAHYRNAAQILLGVYGRCVLDTIPAALRHMIEVRITASADGGDGGGRAGDTLDSRAGHQAYLLACRLHDVCAGAVDDMGEVPVSDPFPMGADIVYMRRVLRNKAVVETSTDMCVQACKLTDVILERGGKRDSEDATVSRSDESAAEALLPQHAFVQPGRIGCAQVAFAYVFSLPVPSARVAQDLLLMRNEADCLKTLNEAALHTRHGAECARFTAAETPVLLLPDFERRVARLGKRMPQVLISAMHTLRLMGPAFFDSACTRPYDLNHPIPYDYALYLEQRFSSKSTGR